MVHTFADSFWDQDFNGTTGYDAVIHRLKDGKKLCDSFSDFLRNRAKIEEDYGKNLMRLAQSAGSNEEVGTLKDSWESLRKETENIGAVHCEYSKKLLELMEKTIKFRERQKSDRVKTDEKMKKSQKEKRMAYENMAKARKTYEQRCREHDQSNREYENKGTFTPKEEDRLKKNLQKTKANAEAADEAYQNSVKSLEECRVRWIFEMEKAMNSCQQFEEDRILFLRTEMWAYTNLAALQLVSEDKLYERNRDVLDNCDVSIDIQHFITQKRTGSEKPASIPYKNYYLPTRPQSNTNSLNKNAVAKPTANSIYTVPDLTQFQLKPQANNHNKRPSNNVSNANNDFNTNSLAAYAIVQKDLINHPAQHSQQPKQYLARVAFEYIAQGDEELTLKVGEMIEVIKEEDESWGIGLLGDRCGAFPLEYVDRVG